MSTLVDVKFREWTAGMDETDSMISVFQHIRDIPYSLTVSMTDPKTAPEQILALGQGYCGPKHYLLGDMYQRLGLEVVYAMYPFLWNEQDLRYPPKLRRLATGLPVVHHLACRVRISNRWVLVDATWDPPLARGGFPVNEHWDGRADTICAVKPLHSPMRTAFSRTAMNKPCRKGHERDLKHPGGEQDHGDAEHSPDYRNRAGMQTVAGIERIRRFYQEFDAWLREIRDRR